MLFAIKMTDMNVKSLWGSFFDWLTDFAVDFLVALLIFVIGVFLIKLLRKLLARILKKRNSDPVVVKFLDSLLKVVGYVVIICLIFSQIGVTSSSIIAVLGAAGLSIGLALQGALKNFAGGVLILLNRPFTVNDYIETEGKEGTVQKMDIIYTTLNTIDNKLVKIPNGKLMDSVITNYTKNQKRRIDLPIGIHYDDDLKLAKEIATKIMDESEYKLVGDDNVVVVKELEDSAVTLEVRMWVKTEDYWNAKFDLNQKLKEAYDNNGITIAYNQLDVHIVEKNS